jgi:hypothetical protein
VLLLPEFVAENLQREQMVDQHLGAAQWLNQAVKARDTRLSIVWGKEQATDPRITPGRWHVRLDLSQEGAPDLYMAITTPDGGYREPDSGVLHEIERRDMTRRNHHAEDLVSARERREADSARKARDARLAAKDDAAMWIKANDMPGVVFGTAGWRNKAKAPREKK